MLVRKYLLAVFITSCCFITSMVHANIPPSITKLFSNQVIIPGKIRLRAPAIAENGEVVSVEIERVQELPAGVFVREIQLFNQYRKEAVATFKLGEHLAAKQLKTRIKLAKSSWVYAIALLSDGSLISGETYIKVTIGGCGGGGYNSVSPSTLYHLAPPPAYTQQSPTPLSNWQQPGAWYQNTEKYARVQSNSVIDTRLQPVSTFSIDVDTGSYANLRRFLQQGSLPLANAVRIEEMINYFSYDYPAPADKTVPFSISTEIGPNPWNTHTHLLQIGLQGYEAKKTTLPPANLVFLIDVSGSMSAPNKLNLLIPALQMLVNQLRAIDHIAIVVYAGASGVVLEPTSGADKAQIHAAFQRLRAGGSTNGGAGIYLAYAVARQHFNPEAINRVILATDGDFNVGVVDHNQLIDLIEKQRRSGITLTTLGFGMGNYNDHLMEQLADKGNGNYAYIDTLREAKKVLVDQMAGTLFTIAKDVKIQVEFNPAVVAEYRLIGYENRALNREDFNNDKVDAGDIGAGHSVTALYEVTLTNSQARRLEPLRYAPVSDSVDPAKNEIAEIRLRYKLPEQEDSRLIKRVIPVHELRTALTATTNNFRFAAAVAAFGQVLRDGKYTEQFNYQQIERLAHSAMESDMRGYRSEFVQLISMASALDFRRLVKTSPEKR